MNKKILITLLLITSLVLFLGCTNPGLEVTCPDGEVVNDIRDCIEDNSDETPTDPELKDGGSPKVIAYLAWQIYRSATSQFDEAVLGNYTCEPIWTEDNYPIYRHNKTGIDPSDTSHDDVKSYCTYTCGSISDPRDRIACCNRERITEFYNPITRRSIYEKIAWCKLEYPFKHPYCQSCSVQIDYSNATCTDYWNNNAIVPCEDLEDEINEGRPAVSHKNLCSTIECDDECGNHNGKPDTCEASLDPSLVRNCNDLGGTHKITDFRCQCACSPASDKDGDGGFATLPPDPPVWPKITANLGTNKTKTTTPVQYDGMTIISTCNELQNINNLDLDGKYMLGQDIDCSDTINWNSGEGFMSIGTKTNPFTGVLNGNKQKIIGLFINRATLENVGLFGNTNNATITNVGLVNNQINGNIGSFSGEFINIGSLVGQSKNSNIINNYSTGNTTGTDAYTFVGGLIGSMDGGWATNNYTTGETSSYYVSGGLIGELIDGVVKDNYTTGHAIGNNIIGGLIGSTHGGTIMNNYSTIIPGAGTTAGGLIGLASSGYIRNNYVIGTNFSVGPIGSTPTLLIPQYQFTNYNAEGLEYFTPFGALEFESDWVLADNGLPELVSQICPKYAGLQELNGDKVVCDCTDLQNINLDLDARYIIGDDITCYNSTTWNNNKGFQPIGDNTNKFTGMLNGDNHIINNLFINRPTESLIGLFGVTQDATIEKINIKNANITGSTNVGTIAGRSITSTLKNISVTGNVNSTSTTQLTRTGGVIGYVAVGNTQLSQISFDGSVTSNGGAVGGIVGVLDGGTITDSFTKGIVTGAHNYAGGITSYVNWTSSIQNTYSIASVTGRKYVGGLVGTIDKEGPNAIINCFSTGPVNGTRDVGGLIGEHYRNSETITNNYYNNTTNNPSNCIGIGTGECTAILDDETYFYNASNEPTASWDFTTIWKESTIDYPALR